MSKRIISAGHICLDITPAFKGEKVANISNILQPGKLVEVGDAVVSTGGSVANTGLGMKLLGADVSLMGKLGLDSFGDMICKIISDYNVNESMIRAKDESTSYSVVVAIPGQDRIFLHNPGANHSFMAKDIPEDELNNSALFHFGYPPLMKSMYDNDGDELVMVMKKAKECGCATSMDLAAVDANSEAGKADWKRILARVIPYVDFFVPSVEELCFMIDRPRFEQWQAKAAGRDITEIIDLDDDIRPLARQCMEMGAKVLLIKCGAPGLYYCSADENKLSEISDRLEIDVKNWADKEGFEKSFKPDAVVSGTGAGDTSIAAFLVSMIEGEEIETCVKLAAATGACCVASYDAISGLKSLAELKAKIASGWEKIC